MKKFEYKVKDTVGLHARPASELVKLAKELDSKVIIKKGDKSSDASKLFGLMGLSIVCGDVINISIEGGNEEASEKKVRDFLEENL